MTTKRIAPQTYEVQGVTDSYGSHYIVVNVWGSRVQPHWHVKDSRGHKVSEHFTKKDAVRSLVES